MTAVWGHGVGVLIVLLMTTFIGIWAWAWLPYHERTFGVLARLPMEDGCALPGDSPPPNDEEQRR